MRLIAGIAFFIGGMAVSIGATSDARNARLLDERGVEATATVTDVTFTKGGQGYGRRYALVDAEFHDELGFPAESSDLLYCGASDAISVGEKVTITYDPEEVLPARFTECPQSKEITIPLIIGVVALALGTMGILWAWLRSGWRRRWIGIPILIVGILFVGTSFDGEYQELIYTGAALIIIGTLPLFAPRRHVTV
jgi:hypothetical protein